MMTRRLLLAFVASTWVLACASNPAKGADDAHDAQLESERKQQQAHADDRSDARQNAAEAQREASEESATGSAATRDRVGADATMTEARALHRAKATERLEKADARATELRTLIAKAGGKASTSSRDAMKTVDTQRTMVVSEMDRLSRATTESWGPAKDGVDAQLDTLEGLVKKAGDEVSAFKK